MNIQKVGNFGERLSRLKNTLTRKKKYESLEEGEDKALRSYEKFYTSSGSGVVDNKFWSQDIDKQLLFLKDPIIKHDLPTITNKGREDLAHLKAYSITPKGKPYPAGLEENFEESVWKTLNNGGYDVSFDEFTASLLIPEERLYYAPLIVYFSKKLATRYDLHYKGKNKWDNRLTKIVQRPSEFEVLTGTPDIGVVVYERKK